MSGILSVCAHTFPSSPKSACQQTSAHVMMSNGHKKHSLDAPCTGPWKVLRLGPKTYTIDWKGKAYTVSIDR